MKSEDLDLLAPDNAAQGANPPRWDGKFGWHDVLPELQDTILSFAQTEHLVPMRAACKELFKQIERTRSFKTTVLSTNAQRRWSKLVPCTHSEQNEQQCIDALKFGFELDTPIHFPDWKVVHWAAVRNATGLLKAVLAQSPGMVNARTSLSRTPLMLAAMEGSDIANLQVLLDHGADLSLDENLLHGNVDVKTKFLL
jgi:hypothetical protein